MMGKDHELLDAARKGNITVVEKILYQKSKRSGPLASLRRGPGANVQDSSGYSALHHAVLNGHTDIVRLLLAYDATPNLPDSRGSSPLHLAAWSGNQDICKMLLTHPHRPANPNLQTVESETPLHCAAQHGHTGALTTLLAHGADPNMRNNRGETPLDLAAQYGRQQAVQMLIRAHPELLLPFKYDSTVDHSPLHLASRNGHKNIVEILLSAGVNVNLLTPSGSALHEAALCGKDSVVKALLDAGADLDLTDSEARTALDLLEQFPPHVTKGIVSVINNHRNSIAYDSESDDMRACQKFISPMSLGSSYENNRISPMHNNWTSQHEGTSPTSSVGSLGPPSPRPRAATADTPGFYVTMAPINLSKVSPTPPKKPPRRNLSVSPTHLQPQSLMSTSVDSGGVNRNPRAAAYEYLFLARSGKGNNVEMDENGQNKSTTRVGSVDQYVQMNPPQVPQAQPRHTIKLANYENTTLRSYNPNRRLRRNRDNYENYSINNTQVHVKSPSDQLSRATTPLSPTHYQQPPTPEHPPPSAVQAENIIHERIRPLSQEYKRRSLQGSGRDVIESGTSPQNPLCSSLAASSGSLSSSVSLSDRSASTDCVEEYFGDVPFAGLFKGSTMALDNPNIGHQSKVERPKSLRTNVSRKSYDITHFNIQSSSDDDMNRLGTSSAANSMVHHQYHSSDGGDDFCSPQRQQTTAAAAAVAVGNSNAGSGGAEQKNIGVLSPFDEQEEWAKISEIMASFGTGLGGRDNVLANDIGQELKSRYALRNSMAKSKSNLSQLQADLTHLDTWLAAYDLEHLEAKLVEHGFDDVNFINNILEEADLPVIGIPEENRAKLMEAVACLPVAQSLTSMHDNNNSSLTVDQWLQNIRLEEYMEIFRKHLYKEMDRICRVWEIELQAVLEITKLGHRKRILHSVASHRQTPPNIEEINADIDSLTTNIMQLNDELTDKNAKDKKIPPVSTGTAITNGYATNGHRHRKNRPAPKPPIRATNLEIRAPSDLLLGVPVGLRTQWRHSASALISGTVKYEVYYMGSTVVKELRGTESTRKSIQKLKRGERVSSAHPTPIVRRPVCLSISHRGVQFIDIESQGTICEHQIRNIDCACQDADDLSHFAYITKDDNQHYCHVFNVDSMDFATEIILTLGQAFEVAYQMALQEATAASNKPALTTEDRSQLKTKNI